MQPLELEVAYIKEDQPDYEALGVKVENDYSWIKVTFFEIANVAPNNDTTSLIVSGGVDFVVNVTYAELVPIIAAAKQHGIVTELMKALKDGV